MKIEGHINQLVVVIFHHMIAIRIENELLFATLLHQINDTNRFIQL